MKSILFKDKLPYLLTILIGLAAYQINNVIELYVNAPTLAYNFSTISENVKEEGVEKVLECQITNLSKEEALRDITINMVYKTDLPDPKQVMEPEIIPIAPSTNLPDTMAISAFGLINEYNIPVIHPGTSYILKMKVLENKEIEELPEIYLKSSQSIKLTDRNLEVWLITNQVLINVILLVIWLAFIVIYFFMLSNKKALKSEAGKIS